MKIKRFYYLFKDFLSFLHIVLYLGGCDPSVDLDFKNLEPAANFDEDMVRAICINNIFFYIIYNNIFI